jgi:hypothetical protein
MTDSIRTMKLADAIGMIAQMGDADVVFAKVPWTPDAEAVISALNQQLGVPDELKQAGFRYFLEKSLIDELMMVRNDKRLNSEQLIDFVIYYAEYDAYPPWLNDIPDIHAG